MSTVDDPRTLGRARLSFANEAEIDEFVSTLERYERGEISPDQWRQYRLVRGTYGQRQTADAQMLRVKIPQGVLNADQLVTLAEVGDRYSRGFGHITTRQNMQFHFVKLHDVEPAMRLLADAGLTTREACGNSVRNITACPYAGVAADEQFDVTPYAEAMTRYLLRHPLSSTLPRKFKIAFEGCLTDHIATNINDLGFRARLDADGQRGFFVTAGGGTAIMPTAGGVIHDFIPARDMARVAEAVLRVFRRLGDYQHKQRNRMKFLIRILGWEEWLRLYREEFAACFQDGVPALDLDPPESEPAFEDSAPPCTPSATEIATRVASRPVRGPGLTPLVVPMLHAGDAAYARWHATNVRPQKQFGYVMAVTSVPLGDLTGEQMRVLGELAAAFGDGTVRVTSEQDVLFRWVKVRDAHPFYQRLAAAGLGLADAGTIADVASCPGAETCRIAVTQSRGLGRVLEDHLRSHPDLVAAADGARIKISGCPNGCGQHHIATIGFQGSVRRVGGQPVPQYFVMIGGDASGDRAAFARLVTKIPARRITEVVDRLIGLYAAERGPDESAPAFFRRVEVDHVRQLLQDLEPLRAKDATPADFVDLGDTEAFRPEVMDGECSA